MLCPSATASPSISAKWASSLGVEGNYTQYQINYRRSYWFNYLPFYHMGARANYKSTSGWR